MSASDDDRGVGAGEFDLDAAPLWVDEPSSSTTKGAPAIKKDAKAASKAEKDREAEEARKRSSKACDNCRKSKCKCTRILDPASQAPVGPCENCLTVGAECTFNGQSRKRGPPKGYIEAIESRLHRMEVLLGGLLGSDDPRAQTLLGELIGDSEARDILARDLKAAADVPDPKDAKRSWKREYIEQQQHHIGSPPAGFQAAGHKAQNPELLHGSFPIQPGQPAFVAGPGSFGSAGPSSALPLPPPPQTFAPSSWLSEEDLLVGGSAPNLGEGGYQRRTPGAESSDAASGVSPGFSGASLGLDPSSASLNANTSPIFAPSSGEAELATSPRQRRRLDGPPPPAAPGPGLGGDASRSLPSQDLQGRSPTSPEERKQMAYAFRLPPIGAAAPRTTATTSAAAASGPVLAPDRVGHTGTSSYTLSTGEVVSARDQLGGGPLNGAEDGEAATNEPLTELADVIGQLSLNENAEVRYHGRSSGLYLISKSQRYRDFFWHFPSGTYWPPLEGMQRKTENEILGLKEGEDPLPDLETQSHLLMAYWTYVHPHFPVCYKVAFLRQYRHALAHPDSIEPSTPAGTGKVPTVLLLCMFAVAARYCDIDKTETGGGKLWPAGQEYLDKARALLNYDYGSSKLVTVQALLLISYREVGVGAMSSAWMTAGMAIRMAQDLGLFRDVEKWFVPIQRFSHEEKQTRKRVWWACVILDRYTASYIGRPGTIHERDYDCGFPSEDEPDEHEQWRPVRLDGTEFSQPPKSGAEALPAENVQFLKSYPPTRAHTLSCFNAAAALAVIINRIISNIYAIRIRVLGQSSETLLSLLDQSLASWYLALPPHLQYNPAGKTVPPPHILSLHLQFYNSLILLHRPFIPGQNSSAAKGTFPSHSICTTAANAIANIVTIWRRTWTLRQCPPFLTYPIFSAGIICVYNASFDESLAHPAKVHLKQCMEALEEMEHIWGSAIRQRELLHGLVDLRDADLTTELGLGATGAHDGPSKRGLKRPGMDVDDLGDQGSGSASPATPGSGIRTSSTFHQKPMGQRQARQGGGRRRSSSASTRSALPPLAPKPAQAGAPRASSTVRAPSSISEDPTRPAGQSSAAVGSAPALFAHQLPPLERNAGEPGANSFDVLNPDLDLSQFKSPPGSSGGTTNYTDLLNAFFPGADGVSWGGGDPFNFASSTSAPAPGGRTLASTTSEAPPGSTAAGGPATTSPVDATPAFFGMPLGANLGDEWLNYSFNAFPGMSDAMAASPPAATSASPLLSPPAAQPAPSATSSRQTGSDATQNQAVSPH